MSNNNNTEKMLDNKTKTFNINNFHTYFIHIKSLVSGMAGKKVKRQESNAAEQRERQTGVNFNYAIHMYGNVIHKKTIIVVVLFG